MSLLPARARRIPAQTRLFRSQWSVAAPTSVAIGPVLLPPAGLRGRFGLATGPVAAFALAPQTALYETFCRGDVVVGVSLAKLALHGLLEVRTTAALTLFDTRAEVTRWPFLTAARYAATQAEAADADAAGAYDGVIYRSVQQQGGECVALFGAAIGQVAAVSDVPLLGASGGLHLALVDALRGAQLALVP